MITSSVSIWVALGGGLLFFFNPCVWPLYPAYVSYIAGSSLSELKTGGYKNKLFKNTLGFILGFSIVFVALGAVATSLGNYYQNQELFERIAGVIIIFFGLQLSGLLKISFLSLNKRLSFLPKNPGVFSSIIFGSTFALGWTPCATPILGAILAYAFTQQTLYEGMFLLGFFSVGFAFPFLLFSILFSYISGLSEVVGNIGKYLPTINRVSGYVLIIIGALLFFNMMSDISFWLFSLLN